MGYTILYYWLCLFTYYNEVSCVKLPHDIAFIAQLPVSQPPLGYQDGKQIYLSKQKWGWSLKVIHVFLYFWSTLLWPFCLKVDRKWELSVNIHYWLINAGSIYCAWIPSSEKYSWQTLVKAFLVHWVYLLYLVQVHTKHLIYNCLVVAPCNWMYHY